MNDKTKALLFGAFSLAAAALFADAPAKSVISINICQGRNQNWVTENGVKKEGTLIGHIDTSGTATYQTLVGDVPAGAWCCTDSQNGGSASATATSAWDGLHKKTVTGQTVGITLAHPSVNNYGYDANGAAARIYSPDYMRMWASQRNGGATTLTMTISSIPYASYSAYVYFSGIPKVNAPQGDTAFPSVAFSGENYVAAQDGTATVSSLTSWGSCTSCATGPVLGTNTIKFQNLSGGSFVIQYQGQDCGVAAVQIVDEGEYDYEGGGEEEDGDRPTASVYSFSVCDGEASVGHIGADHAPLYSLCGWLPADAWNEADKTPGNYGNNLVLANYWDAGNEEVKSDGIVTVKASGGVNNSAYDNNGDPSRVYGPDYMRMFLSKRNNGFEHAGLTFGAIPFSRYSAIVYLSGVQLSGVQMTARTAVNDGKAFYPVRVNGNVYYSWDETSASVASVSNDWGDCSQALSGVADQTDGVAYGKNAIRIDGLVGQTLSLDGPCYAAGIAAVQIVDDSSDFVDGKIATSVAEGMSLPISGDAAEVTTPYSASGIVKSGPGTLLVTTTLTYPITLSGGTVRLLSGTGEGGSIAAAQGTRIEIMEDLSKDGVETVTYTGAPSVAIIGADGVARNPNVTTDGSTRTYTFVPSVAGAACLCDMGFERSLVNAGSSGGEMSAVETQYGENIYLGEKGVYTGAHPDVGTVEIWYTDSWTAVVKGKLPAYPNAVFASFGGMQNVCLALVTRSGAGNALSGVSLVRYSGGTVTELCGLDLPSATTAEHLFVVKVENVQGGKNVTLSVDGRSATTATANVSNFGTMGTSARVGSAKNYTSAEGLVEFSGYGQVPSGDERKSYVKALRVYGYLLGPNAMSAVASELGAYQPGFVIYVR